MSVRRPPLRSGQVSSAFAHLLDGHGASPRLMRRVRASVEDRPDGGTGPDPGPTGSLRLLLRRVSSLLHTSPRDRLLRELRERQDFADGLLQSMQEAVMVLDAHSRVIDVNRRWEELTANLAVEEAGAPPHVRDRLPIEASILHRNLDQPIAAVALLAELLAADWAELPDDTRRELSSKIDRTARRLVTVMNDLRLLSGRAAAGGHRRPVLVAEIVADVVSSLTDSATGVAVDVDPSAEALVVRDHLHRIVESLITNAVQYGRPPIEVGARRGGDDVVLSVRDHGNGIPEYLVPGLFEDGWPGTGLGLAVTHHLVEANGGTLRYEPASPRGARLIVTLRAASRVG